MNSTKALSMPDAVIFIVGIVLGAGIFKTPSLVAASAGTKWAALFLWGLGGMISLVGSLCYAELGSAFPHRGGDYHYLSRAYGNVPAFLFAWARMTIIQTGSIAMLAFLIGDYASEVVRMGEYSASFYAAAIILLLTAVNIAGINRGKHLQRGLMTAYLLGLAVLLVAGFSVSERIDPVPSAETAFLHQGAPFGKAMVFVLLTYGGWNEASYLSAEIRDNRRNMSRALIYSVAIITAIYLLVNYVLLRGLGFTGVSGSEAVAADLMRSVAGRNGASFISILIVLASLSTVNAMIVTGARTGYALGRDFRPFSFLSRWQQHKATPANALLAQGTIALLLVLAGTGDRSGFVMMVEYTAPVFWLFFLLVGISVMVLRTKERTTSRPFRVPFYPLTPILFCAVCVYMFHSSLAYAGKGALLGMAVLLAGLPLLLLRGFDPEGSSREASHKKTPFIKRNNTL